MHHLGYGPDNRHKVKVATRELPFFRDPAVILIDQLKELYVDGEFDTVDSALWFPKVMRKDYVVGPNLSGSGPDPGQNLYLLYGCGGDLRTGK
jgi:peptide/nickel transport system substrate-binding protein